MKKLMYLLLLSVCIFQGCKKDDVDLRDKFVGVWNVNATGSLTYLQGTTVIGTSPQNSTSTEEIKKVGANQLDFGGTTAIYDGTSFIFSPETTTQTANGVTINIKRTLTGTPQGNEIIVKIVYSGTWSNANGATGTLQGDQLVTYTKI